MNPRLVCSICISVLLAGCAAMPSAPVPQRGPRFAPERFFAGRTFSSGVFENVAGKPRERFRTVAHGRLRGDVLTLRQKFTFENGRTQERLWQIRRVGNGEYEGVANDVVGVARGRATGNTFRFRYTVALKPGNPLFNVRLDQVMTLRVDGVLENRAVISKLGVKVSEVTEQFRRVD